VDPMLFNLYLRDSSPSLLSRRTLPRKQQLIERDYASIVWSSETADNSYQLGQRYLQNGSIRTTFFVDKTPGQDPEIVVVEQ
jgi:hypothetical protein